ncbi:hypothetical protein [Mesobacillus harenae]|uniref:hypothetical protein n=1 Tax=Mesobacillus harenae TaxID=2213203 RepID=UPI00157FF85D|nr:hypothetical protein [Mesobacillus harenae]
MKKLVLASLLLLSLFTFESATVDKVDVADLPSQHSLFLADLPSQHSLFLADLPSQHSLGNDLA